MIKVRIYEMDSCLTFDTEMPKIPEKNDQIGAWFDDEWWICEIDSFIYHFEKTGNFSMVEINVISR
jgi:hypothetical protein